MAVPGKGVLYILLLHNRPQARWWSGADPSGAREGIHSAQAIFTVVVLGKGVLHILLLHNCPKARWRLGAGQSGAAKGMRST